MIKRTYSKVAKILIFFLLGILVFLPEIHAQSCTGSLGAPVVNITFGSGSNSGAPLASGITSYSYINAPGTPPANVILDGSYSIINGVPANSAWFIGGSDHTGDANGYMAFFNASTSTGVFYQQTVSNLCPGTTYQFSAWIANVVKASTGLINLPNVTLNIVDPSTNAVLGSINTGDIPNPAVMTWNQYSMLFLTPAGVNSVKIVLTNNHTGGNNVPGNDLAIDDITFRACGPLTSASFSPVISQTTLTACSNTNINLYGNISSGLVTPSYQWQMSTDNGLTFTNIPGATSLNYTITGLSAGNYKLQLLSAENGNIGSSICRFVSNVLSLNVITCTNTLCNNWLSTPTLPSYVTIGDLDIPGNKLTVEATINLTQPYLPGTGDGNDGDIVSKHQGPTDANYLLRPNHAYITTSNGFFATTDVCAIELNKTYHLAMVYDGTTLKYYRNGFLMSQVPATGNLFQNDFPTRLGLYTGLTLENFKGYMNEVRIWNVARTQAEIRSYMNTSLPSPTTQTGLQAYYTFDNLLNKQGNTAWNGTLSGSAAINATNPSCTFTADSCAVVVSTVTASFTAPDEVCVNTPVQVTNTSQNASNYYWSFCETSFASTPSAVNLGNPGGVAQSPVFQDLVKDESGNYFGFLTNNFPSGLVRYSFGNSLLNTPTVDFLGNPGNKIPGNAEGIQVVKGPNGWVAIIVGGDPVGSSNTPALATITFGASLSNPAPTASNFGNIGNMSYPIDLYVFTENNKWYGYTVNFRNNTITRFDFGTDFLAPTAVNLGNIGGLTNPVGIGEIKDGDNWYMFITNETNNTLTRLSFGTSLLNTPTGVNLGNPPGSQFGKPRDISFIRLCDGIVGLAVNGDNNTITKLDFGNTILGTPVASSLGNIGSLSFPHSISKLFRENSDIYAFIPNVTSNTISRIRFSGCQNIPGSNQQTPGPITYTQTGTYNINLIVDIGLPTQASVCKKIIVKDCATTTTSIINDYTPVLALNPCNNSLTVEDGTMYNAGDTVLIIQMKGAVIDSTNTAAFGTITDYKNAGNYEFNYVKNKTGNVIELKNILTRQYDIPNGKVQLIRVPYYNTVDITNTLTCLPWDGSKGGVLAFNVKDTLKLNADIDVSGKGFRGGNTYNVGPAVLSCYQTNYFLDSSSTISARKGEGIADISFGKLNGRGHLANGGGGGNGHNSGGGGGSNAATGGLGGYELYECNNSIFDNRGISGAALNYSNAANKIYLGGGGGGGHKDGLPTQTLSSAGGDGGGIVIISAQYLKSNTHAIIANGAHGKQCDTDGFPCLHDGMGGGGGAGTILLDIANYLDNHQEKVMGGKGADLTVYTSAAGHVGPGGGGGGGTVWFSSTSTPVNATINNAGGVNGTIVLDSNNPFGSTSGSNGINLFNLVLPISTTAFKANIDSVRFNQTLINCSKFDFTGLGYTNTSPIVSWQWYFGDGGTASTQNTSHTYATAGAYDVKLVVTDINGCKDSIIKTVNPGTPALVNAGLDTAYCSNTAVTVFLHGNAGASSYNWQPAAPLNNNALQDPTGIISSTTRFYLTVTNAAGCSGIDSVDITINPLPVVRTLKDTAICKNTTLILTTTAGLSNYHWSPGIYVNDSTISAPQFIDIVDRTLYVTGTDANGCSAKDTINIAVKPLPNIKTINDTTICSTNTLTLYTSGGQSYTWIPATELSDPHIESPVYSGTHTHIYYVTGTGVNGCKAEDTVKVTVNVPGTFKTPPDKIMCEHAYARLDGYNGPTFDYLWSPAIYLNNTGIINPIATPPYSTPYNVQITDKVCAYTENFKVQVTVDPLPFIDAGKSNDIDCAHYSAVLTAYGLSYNYTWSPATGLSSTTIANPVAKPASTQLYILTAKDSIGCTNKDSVTVYVKTAESLLRLMPNAFTPNGDGHNDCYGMPKWMYVKQLQFAIFNRWGEKVFFTNNQADCWDGNYKGKPAQAGGYVFYIKAETDCGTEEQKGNFILIR